MDLDDLVKLPHFTDADRRWLRYHLVLAGHTFPQPKRSTWGFTEEQQARWDAGMAQMNAYDDVIAALGLPAGAGFRRKREALWHEMEELGRQAMRALESAGQPDTIMDVPGTFTT